MHKHWILDPLEQLGCGPQLFSSRRQARAYLEIDQGNAVALATHLRKLIAAAETLAAKIDDRAQSAARKPIDIVRGRLSACPGDAG
jgi:hypothetical protein